MWQRLLSCADQAAATLLRTSFSTVVAASHDFRYAITDAYGNSLAQSYYGEVMFVTSFPDCVKNIVAAIGRDEIRPGDVYLTNDPWLAAGHLPDIHVETPVFFGERLVGFSGSVIDISDIGGRFGAHDRPRYSRKVSASSRSPVRRGRLMPTSWRFSGRRSRTCVGRGGRSRAGSRERGRRGPTS